MTQLEKIAHGWITLAEGIVTILSLGFWFPCWTGNHYEKILSARFKIHQQKVKEKL